ncbi:MAG: phosphate acyltransferase [Syntrophales bacterium]|jgi:phosphate butyryltransferase|nr:phosphate acyltransferase [Syntrophales bacterium]MCK9392206.1 phosphate acyltransferase [Syntrophales bacterium]
MMNSFNSILAAAKQKGAKKVVVPFPNREDIDVLAKAVESGLIIPILIGRRKEVQALLDKTLPASLEHEIVDEQEQQHALIRAITYIREDRADILMQGGIAHQVMMDAVLDKNTGFKNGRLASYISLFQLKKQEKLILITDTFLNNYPIVLEKQLILENALKVVHMMGLDEPKVAVIAAIEQVNPGIPSTLDAAILSKMSDRRQFGKAIVEGPLDMDCALSHVAAGRKGLKSVVTGNADIYLVPEIDTGYLLAESLVFFGKMQAVGVVMGTSKPVILNLPFVTPENRLVEIALASLIAEQGG